MTSYALLDQQDEDKLHKTRLLNIEEKPFKRITKRLLTPGSLISIPKHLPPTPPPDGGVEDTNSDVESIQRKQLEERRRFHDDVLLDFAAFDSSIVRLQFLHQSNEAERERYRTEKDRILKKAQEVKENTAELHIQLESARQTMEQRKKFDELAEKITNNRLLRPREDQEVNLRKLEEECRELEKESQTYSETWKERREQFGRIVEEGLQLRRLIRDEKEEVERREGMDGGEEDGEVGESGSRGGATPKHGSQSGNATPRPDNAATPKPESEASPRSGYPDGLTMSRGHHNLNDGLKPLPLPAGSQSRPGSRVGSRASSRVSIMRGRQEPEDGEDTIMIEPETESKEADTNMVEAMETQVIEDTQQEAPSVTVNAPNEEEPIADSVTTGELMDTT